MTKLLDKALEAVRQLPSDSQDEIARAMLDLAGASGEALPNNFEKMRAAGKGPWAPSILAEDARRLAEFKRTGEGVPWDEVAAWMRSWGTAQELPPPKLRKL
jgi:hypothetical protein